MHLKIGYNLQTMHKLGAHLSTAGGYHNALNKIVTIGGTCLQIFSSSPRSWSCTPPSDIQVQQFKELKEKLKIDPVYFHACYLINLANDFQAAVSSRNSLIQDLQIAHDLGIKGVIIHLGSFKGKDLETSLIPGVSIYDDLVLNIKSILKETPEDTLFIIENAGNNKIGKDLAQIAAIIDMVESDRIRVCLDTCHLYSAGYDLSTQKKLDNFLTSFETLIGVDKLEVWHINDSKDPYNSGRDRHENIGEGTLSLEPFKLILNHKKLKHLPFIIEVPGFDDKGPDKQNLDILQSLLQ